MPPYEPGSVCFVPGLGDSCTPVSHAHFEAQVLSPLRSRQSSSVRPSSRLLSVVAVMECDTPGRPEDNLSHKTPLYSNEREPSRLPFEF